MPILKDAMFVSPLLASVALALAPSAAVIYRSIRFGMLYPNFGVADALAFSAVVLLPALVAAAIAQDMVSGRRFTAQLAGRVILLCIASAAVAHLLVDVVTALTFDERRKAYTNHLGALTDYSHLRFFYAMASAPVIASIFSIGASYVRTKSPGSTRPLLVFSFGCVLALAWTFAA